ncbi:heat shock cognate 70 kDa protein-like protein [Tanacetum coccineum]
MVISKPLINGCMGLVIKSANAYLLIAFYIKWVVSGVFVASRGAKRNNRATADKSGKDGTITSESEFSDEMMAIRRNFCHNSRGDGASQKSLLTEIGSRFVTLLEERLLAVVNALLHRCYKYPTATTAEVPQSLKKELSGVCRPAFQQMLFTNMLNLFSDSTVQTHMKLWPFKVIVVEHKGKYEEYSLEEISCMILKNLKEFAEAFLATKVADALITVLAYFSDKQRHAIKDAGTLAALNVKRLINEPTTANSIWSRKEC